MTGPRRNATTITPRVEEAGKLISGGLGNREIANNMSVSLRVVEGYVNELVWTLGLNNYPREAKRVLIARYFLLQGKANEDN